MEGGTVVKRENASKITKKKKTIDASGNDCASDSFFFDGSPKCILLLENTENPAIDRRGKGEFFKLQPSWLVISESVNSTSSARAGHVVTLDLWTGISIRIHQASLSHAPSVATPRRLGPWARGSQQGGIHQSRRRGDSEHLRTAKNQVGFASEKPLFT